MPSSSKGVLWYDDDDKIKKGDTFDSDEIDDISFEPDKDYSGTFTINYTGYDTDDNDFSGKITITVKEGDGDADDITYSVKSNSTVDFDSKDFEDACDDANDEDLDYIKFTSLPPSSKGILYLNYEDEDDPGSKVSTSKSYDSDDIDDMTFVPDEDFSGTITINYKGYDVEDDSFKGVVEITVKTGSSSSSSSSSGDINYSGDADEDIDFDEDDFNDYCQDENDEDLDYVTFTIPSSSKGVLWYDYDGKNEKKVDKSTKYYYDQKPSIDDITFVPDKGFSGNVSIDFSGKDEEGDSIKGTVVISVDNEDLEADDIFLSGTAGTPALMQDLFFSQRCTSVLKDTLDYVKFTLPAASNGTLYYDYTTASNSTKVTASTKYYYGNSPYLNKVSFVSAGTAAGKYTVEYTAYGKDGGSFTGKVSITLTAGTSTPAPVTGGSSKYFSDVKGDYSWAVSYVDTLYSAGIVKGSTGADGKVTYNPASKITRGDFMTLLFRALNLPLSTASGNFSDVAAGTSYYDAIASAKAMGVAQGSENKFYPNSTITREDAMVLTQRAMSASGNSVGIGSDGDLSSYSDKASVSSYAKDAISALIKAGIITGGADGKLHPKDSITRVEAAAMIYRIKY